MQISSRTEDFLIDTIALRDQLNILNNVFTNPNVVKVMWIVLDLRLEEFCL